mgnify:CR=1 FL=1
MIGQERASKRPDKLCHAANPDRITHDLLARTRFPGRRLLLGIVDLPVVVPHPVAGIALLLFLGRHSPVGGALGSIGLEFVSHIPGIVAGMLFVSAPLLVSGAREAFTSGGCWP